jgi:hypothetical protein
VIVPNKPLNNTLLGDLVVKLLELAHPEDLRKSTLKFATNPDFLALKLVLLGY